MCCDSVEYATDEKVSRQFRTELRTLGPTRQPSALDALNLVMSGIQKSKATLTHQPPDELISADVVLRQYDWLTNGTRPD